MQLNHGLHLAYCTNIHRGEDWAQTFDSLQRYTMVVRERVSPGKPYAIGLRLSEQAARELATPGTLKSFQEWLKEKNCYVFTINGFPYGKFHGTRVKEQVYAPDWTTRERLEFTNLLFDILAQLVPAGVEGSVSTVPCSYKEFIQNDQQVKSMRDNVWACVEETGRMLHLGLEPEPLCFLETSTETVDFINQVRAEHPNDARLGKHLGVNYDTCHLAVEFEEPRDAVRRFLENGIKISKIHLSSALKVRSTSGTRAALAGFADDIYFHQVIERGEDGNLKRYRDLDVALAQNAKATEAKDWRIHFHIPLHSQATSIFDNTTDHLLGLLDILKEQPNLCSHLEMETYTWEVMPSEMKKRDVVDQLVAEYDWTLKALTARGLGSK
jgi:hypothetical protein